jgi:hypothetical protein
MINQTYCEVAPIFAVRVWVAVKARLVENRIENKVTRSKNIKTL